MTVKEMEPGRSHAPALPLQKAGDIVNLKAKLSGRREPGCLHRPSTRMEPISAPH
jgi:hypothetical protein